MKIEQAFATVKNADFTDQHRQFFRGIKAEMCVSPSAVQLAKTAIQQAAMGSSNDPEKNFNELMDTLLTMITLAYRAGQISTEPELTLTPPEGKVRVN